MGPHLTYRTKTPVFLGLLIPVFHASVIFAQLPSKDSICHQRDLPDLIHEWKHRPPKIDTISTGSLLLVPVIGTNPATGFSFGVAGQYAFTMHHQNTLYSSLSANLTVTTKGQTIVQLKNNIYTRNNRVFLTGDWRFMDYSQDTYGLGSNAPESGALKYQYNLMGQETTNDSLAQPMKFNFVRFHQIVTWKIKEGFYAGGGYFLDGYFGIQDQKLDTVKPLYTSHYLYNKMYGFSTKSYVLSAVNVNLIFDTRDNLINPYKGYFASVNFRFAPKVLGNKQTNEFLNVEWRSFHSLSRRNPRHLISFWMLGNFTSASRTPYLILPALAYDQRGRSGRGYTQGRFRGPNMVYGEAEYRFPISRCGGILGGVLFLNATTADNPVAISPVRLFQYIAPGYGFGLRMMVDKKSRTNLQLDFGFGKNSTGVYLGAAETF